MLPTRMTTFHDAVYCLTGKQRSRWPCRGRERRKAGCRAFPGRRAGQENPRFRVKSGEGAGDETRTRDNLLGRQALYQLSYSRTSRGERIRTSDLSVPNAARCQLRHTPRHASATESIAYRHPGPRARNSYPPWPGMPQHQPGPGLGSRNQLDEPAAPNLEHLRLCDSHDLFRIFDPLSR